MPNNMSFGEGAMIEPLAIAVYACKKAGISLGQKVLITGAGTIGLLTGLTAKAYGAVKVCITGTSINLTNLFVSQSNNN